MPVLLFLSRASFALSCFSLSLTQRPTKKKTVFLAAAALSLSLSLFSLSLPLSFLSLSLLFPLFLLLAPNE